MKKQKSVNINGEYFKSQKDAAKYYGVSENSLYKDMKRRGVSFASALNKAIHNTSKKATTTKDKLRNQIRKEVKRLRNEFDIVKEAGGVLNKKYNEKMQKELHKAEKMSHHEKGKPAEYSTEELRKEVKSLKGIKREGIESNIYAVRKYEQGKGYTGNKVKKNSAKIYRNRKKAVQEKVRLLNGLDSKMQKVLSNATKRNKNEYGGWYGVEDEKLESTIEELSLAYSENRDNLTEDQIGRIYTLLDPIESILYDSDGDSGGMLIDVSDEIYQILTGNHMENGGISL